MEKLMSNASLKRTHLQSWFIPIDLLMIISTALVVILAFVFLIIIVLNKTYRTVPMMLLCNSFVSEIIFASAMLSMAIVTLHNDIKRIEFQDYLCVFRAYMTYSMSAVRSHSYLLQALYRYITVMYPKTSYWQSGRSQSLFICLTWFISIIHPFPFLFTNQIEYNVDNQVCHMPLHNHPYIFYTCFLAYLNPITIIIVIYFKLVRYVREMNRLVAPVNQILRAQRELKMVRRIVRLVVYLVTLGLPYTAFFAMSFFTVPPKYHFRIAFLFVDLSLVGVMIALFQFTDQIRHAVTKKLTSSRTNTKSIPSNT